jgi:hypothetical protein
MNSTNHYFVQFCPRERICIWNDIHNPTPLFVLENSNITTPPAIDPENNILVTSAYSENPEASTYLSVYQDLGSPTIDLLQNGQGASSRISALTFDQKGFLWSGDSTSCIKKWNIVKRKEEARYPVNSYPRSLMASAQFLFANLNNGTTVVIEDK